MNNWNQNWDKLELSQFSSHYEDCILNRHDRWGLLHFDIFPYFPRNHHYSKKLGGKNDKGTVVTAPFLAILCAWFVECQREVSLFVPVMFLFYIQNWYGRLLWISKLYSQRSFYKCEKFALFVSCRQINLVVKYPNSIELEFSNISPIFSHSWPSNLCFISSNGCIVKFYFKSKIEILFSKFRPQMMPMDWDWRVLTDPGMGLTPHTLFVL